MIRPFVVLAWLALAGCSPHAPAAPAEKPEVALLTSLPIIFSEQFTLDAPANPLRQALEQEVRLVPVDGPEQLVPKQQLLAIQPQALTAERLVALDRWVRGGGRLVLLADPRLEWESSRPLGDKFRPPFEFPDTGLLAHWGLTLAAGEEGPAPAQVGGTAVTVVSPGVFTARGKDCRVADGGLVATCRLGKGQAIVVADADWVMAGNGALDPGEAAKAYPALIGLLRLR